MRQTKDFNQQEVREIKRLASGNCLGCLKKAFLMADVQNEQDVALFAHYFSNTSRIPYFLSVLKRIGRINLC
jgi:hypothetical protein